MQYLFSGHVAANNRNVDVTKEDYERVRRAVESLLRALEVEEKYDMLLQNYDELEAEVDSASRRAVLFRLSDWSSKVGDIHRVNRRILNFMSAARMYLDQVDHDLSTAFGSGATEQTAFNDARQAQHNARLGYRVFEALRNYSQHRGIPVHGISYNVALREDGGQKLHVRTIRPTLDVDRVSREGGFKAAVLRELQARGAEAPLMPLVRDYASGLGQVHSTARSAFQLHEPEWRDHLASAKSMYVEAVGDHRATLLSALWRDEEGKQQSTQVFEEFLPRLEELRTRNRTNVELTRQLRSSE